MPAAAGAPEVSGYEIISKLGAGASGEVWIANEQQTGRVVALKILHRRGGGSASAEVLRREIRTPSELVHPKIVQTVSHPDDVDDELRHLAAVLSRHPVE